MASVTSNKTNLFRAVFGLSQAMNLRRRFGAGSRLGDELIDAAAAAIEDRTANRQQGPDGRPLPRLRPRTIARKRARGLDTRILIETHEMLDFAQVRGKTVVTSNVAAMTAGLDTYTQFKVEQAEEGAPNRPKRHFYDLGRDGEKAVDALLGEVTTRAILDAERA